MLDRKSLDLILVVEYFFPGGLLSWNKSLVFADSSTTCMFLLLSVWLLICCLSDNVTFTTSLNSLPRWIVHWTMPFLKSLNSSLISEHIAPWLFVLLVTLTIEKVILLADRVSFLPAKKELKLVSLISFIITNLFSVTVSLSPKFYWT